MNKDLKEILDWTGQGRSKPRVFENHVGPLACEIYREECARLSEHKAILTKRAIQQFHQDYDLYRYLKTLSFLNDLFNFES